MGVLRHHSPRRNQHRCRRLPTLTAFTLLLFSYYASATSLRQLSGEVVKRHQNEKKENGPSPLGTEASLVDRGVEVKEQKKYGGPGSSPPSCRSKCGWCTPCVAVHVPIQPGLSFPLEYYPEAWRCKCGNKLYMP